LWKKSQSMWWTSSLSYFKELPEPPLPSVTTNWLFSRHHIKTRTSTSRKIKTPWKFPATFQPWNVFKLRHVHGFVDIMLSIAHSIDYHVA
jgi:hypothetical protein